MTSTRIGIALVAVVFFAVGCTPPGPPPVQRVGADTQIDLSGNWNDTDANQVAKAMIADCLSRPWANQFKAAKGKNPVVKLYPIKNRSAEHIKAQYFTKQVEMELVNSGFVEVVAASNETDEARAEREDQSEHSSDATAKQNQRETGADFILNGWVVTQNDAAGGQEVRAYVTTMELINVETQRKVWLKVHRIKKGRQPARVELVAERADQATRLLPAGRGAARLLRVR